MPSTSFYSNCAVLAPGCILYNEPAHTTKVAYGYYSDGINCYFVGDFTDGTIDTVTNCSAVVTTTAPPVCNVFDLNGGPIPPGRMFHFRPCGGTGWVNVNVPNGDSATYCIIMPYAAAGAVDTTVDCSPG